MICSSLYPEAMTGNKKVFYAKSKQKNKPLKED
jgi:hypothetical protein